MADPAQEFLESGPMHPSHELTLFKSMLDTACVLLPVCFFVAPATVFYPAFINKTKIEVPPLAFTCQALQSFIWFLFGSGLPNWGDRIVVYIPNAIGVVTGVLWVVAYPYFMKTVDDDKTAASSS